MEELCESRYSLLHSASSSWMEPKFRVVYYCSRTWEVRRTAELSGSSHLTKRPLSRRWAVVVDHAMKQCFIGFHDYRGTVDFSCVLCCKQIVDTGKGIYFRAWAWRSKCLSACRHLESIFLVH